MKKGTNDCWAGCLHECTLERVCVLTFFLVGVVLDALKLCSLFLFFLLAVATSRNAAVDPSNFSGVSF